MPRVGPRILDHESEGLGIVHGSFKWNAVEEKSKSDKANVKMTSSEDNITEAGLEPNGESMDHQFELKDISVKFPDGKLSCITGPTASGKTAILVGFVSLAVLKLLIIYSDGAAG